MKVMRLSRVVFLILLLVGIVENLTAENMPAKIAELYMRNISQNLKTSGAENIGVYGFIVESDNTNFQINKFFNVFINGIKSGLKKIDNIDIIDTDDLSDADNKIDVYSSDGVEFRRKLKLFFEELDMDLLITGSFVFKNNELNILLKYVDKRRLIEIPVMKKIVKKNMMPEYLNKNTNSSTNKNYKSYVINNNEIEFVYYSEKAKTVKIAYKFLNNPGDILVLKKMIKDENGYWRIKLNLNTGMLGYKFIVDGYEKIDPMNKIKKDDGYAGFFSIADIKGVTNEP